MIDSNHFAQIINANPLPCLLVAADAPQFTIAAISKTYAVAAGSNQSALLNKSIADSNVEGVALLYGNGINGLLQSFNTVLKTGKADKFISNPVNRNGNNGEIAPTVNYESIPILNDDKSIAFIYHCLEDNPAEINALESTGRIDANHEALINASDDYIWSVDSNFCIITVNNAVQAMSLSLMNTTLKEGDPILRKEFGDEIYTMWADFYKRTLQGESISFHHKITNPSNHNTEYRLVNTSPMFNTKGEIFGAACRSKNITNDTLTLLALEKAKEELSDIINSSPDIICTFDGEGKFIKVNDAIEKILGYSPQEMIGKPSSSLILPEDFERFKVARNALKVDNHKSFFEHRCICKDGSLKWIAWSARWDDEKQTMFGIGRDITNKIKNEETILASEKKYRYLFENNPSPMLIWDLGTQQIIGCNEEAVTKYGYSKPEFLQLKLIDIRPPDDNTLLQPVVQFLKMEGDVFKKSVRHKKKNGDMLYVDINAHIIESEGKKVALVHIIDVTEKLLADEEREHALRQLKENQRKLLSAQRTAKLGYWLFDAAKENVFWSDEVYKIWNLPKKKSVLTYKHFLNSIHPDDKEVFDNAYKSALQNHTRLNIQHRIVLADGTIKWVHEKGRTVKGTKKNGFVFEGTIQDITEQKLLSLSLEESNQRYLYVTKATSDAIWDWDLATNALYWGEGFQHIFGYPVSENAQSIYSGFKNIHPEDRKRVQEKITGVIESREQMWTDTYRYKKENGTYADVADRGFILRNKAGKAYRMVGAMQDISKQKAEGQWLKLLESVVYNTNDAVMITWAAENEKSDRSIIYINESFTRITGYTQQELAGRSPTILSGPDTDIAAIKKYKASVKNFTPYETTAIAYKKNGQPFWAHSSVTPLLNDKGEYKYWISIQRDITYQKAAEASLNRALKEKESILESIGDAFFAVDKNWMVTYWNNKAEQILRLTKAQVLNKNLWEGYHYIDNEIFNACFNKAMNHNTVQRLEIFSERLNIWFDVSAFPSANGLSVYFKDISARKIAEQQIKSERNLLRTLIDNLPHAIYFKDNGARKLISNKQDCYLSGVEHEEEVLGKTDLEIFPQDEGRVGYDHDISVINGGKPLIDFEFLFKPKNGAPIWLLTTKLPLYNEQHEVVGLLGIGRDVTQQKETEQDLLVLNQELNKHVKQLAVSNSELEQFAYIASHDLQEPLRMVTSFLTQIEKKYQGILDESGKQFIHFAVDGAKRMRQIILDLLKYSRVGHEEDKKELIDLKELVNEVLLLCSGQIKETKAIVTVDEMPLLFAARSPMRQVFQNLISNSLKYHDKESGTQLRIKVSAKEQTYFWEFSVADNGIGIDPAFFEKIFVLFQRLHNKSEYSGTGIGLSITKKIIDAIGGKIRVESAEGEGSTFYFTVPKKI